MKNGGYIGLLAFACLLATLAGGPLVFAVTSDVGELEREIAERKSTIDEINSKLEEYRARIAQYSKESASLLNDVALIENQVAMAELDIAATQNAIEAQNLELTLLEERMQTENERLNRQREMLSAMLFSLNRHEEQGTIAAFIGAESFHDAFDTVTQLEQVNAGLESALDATKTARANLEADKAEHELKLTALIDLEVEHQARVEKLSMQQQAKELLLSQTAESEAEYRTLMSELRQEQQYISSQIALLQDKVAAKLGDADAAGDASVMSWPLTGRITTTFYDPTYPFRHLFEHSAIDIAVPVATSVTAAAPGYVAWARTGSQYGNYIMIIHANGMATLYAHLMRMDVAPDQYVARGQQIGLSGGKPGMAGAGLSTGPHLHFEVRKDGVPVNPMKYLTDY